MVRGVSCSLCPAKWISPSQTPAWLSSTSRWDSRYFVLPLLKQKTLSCSLWCSWLLWQTEAKATAYPTYQMLWAHLVSWILHQLKRQQTCPIYSMGMLWAAPTTTTNPPQPQGMYEDSLSLENLLLLGGLTEAVCRLTSAANKAQQLQLGQHNDVLMYPFIEIYMILVFWFFSSS